MAYSSQACLLQIFISPEWLRSSITETRCRCSVASDQTQLHVVRYDWVFLFAIGGSSQKSCINYH